ncbi:hypothetical protein K8I61_05535 [bacterium]|nr:hypothetical protein [bacterium]
MTNRRLRFLSSGRLSSRRRTTSAGIAVVDLLVVIAIVIALGLVGAKAWRLLDRRYVPICRDNRGEVDRVARAAIREAGADLARLSAAYVVGRETTGAQLVVVLAPKGGDVYPERLVVDLDRSGFTASSFCPTHRDREVNVPVIDYWYGDGKWWCLHSPLHN